MSEPIPADELQRRWARTLGPTADLERVDPQLTQRPVEVGGTLSSLATVSSTISQVATLGGTLSQQATVGSGASATAATDDPTPGYDLVDELGRGGMGVVYRAKQRSLVRDIALKFIKPEALVGGARERFIAEALVNGLLDHPNIVPVHEMGATAQGDVYLAMKLVGGRSWKALLHPENDADRAAAGGYDLDRHLGILSGVCNAIAFAHSRGILHRDLKPENVMVGEFGEVLVMDWGIAVDIREQPDGDQRAQHKTTITAPSGTPSYMAPELAEGRGRDFGPWTDVYLLGAILHEILTGSPPHRGRSLMAVLLAASESRPPEYPSSVQPGLAAIATTAMAREPQQRYRTISAFQAALAEYVKHRESTTISDGARAKLDALADGAADNAVARNRRYADYAEAIAGFRQALLLWPDNAAAAQGEIDARLAYATTAFAGGDLGLAEAQLDGLGEADGLRQRIVSARREAAVRARAATRNRRLLIGATAAIVIGLIVGALLVNAQRARAVQAEQDALTQRDSARTSQEQAELASSLARERLAASLRKRAQDALRQGDAALTVLSDLEALPLLDGDAAAAVRLRLAATAPALVVPTVTIPVQSGYDEVFWHSTADIVFTSRESQILASYHADSGKPAFPLIFHPKSQVYHHFIADGTRLITAGLSGLWFWDSSTGAQIAMALPPDAPKANALAEPVIVAIAPDGQRVLAARRDKLRWFDREGAPQSDIITAAGEIVKAVIRADGSVVTLQESVYPQPRELWLGPLVGGKAWAFKPPQDEVMVPYAYGSPDGNRMYVCASGITAVMLDLRSLKPVGVPRPDLRSATSAYWSPDSSLLAIGDGSRVRLFSPQDFAPAQRRAAEIDLPGTVGHIAWHPDSVHLAVASSSTFSSDGELGQISIIETRTGKPIAPPIPHRGRLAWSPDGKRLAVAGDNLIRIYTLPVTSPLFAAEIGKRDGMDGVVRWIGDGPDCELLGGTVRRYELGQGMVGEAWKPLTTKSNWFRSARGDIGIWVDDHRALQVVDLKRRQRLGERIALPDIIGGAEVSADGRILAVSYQHRIRLIDLQQPDQSIADFTTGNLVDGVSWDSAGERVLIWGSAGKTLVCDRSGTILTSFFQRATTRHAAWDPACTRIATLTTDDELRIWDAVTGAQLAETNHEADDFAWSSDGASIMANGRLHLQRYDAKDLQPLAQKIRPPPGQFFALAAWHPTVPWLVAAGENSGVIRLWDAQSGEPLSPAIPLRSQPNALLWNPTGTHLVTDDLSWHHQLLALPRAPDDLTQLRQRAELFGRRRITTAPLPEMLDAGAILAGYRELGVVIPE